MGHLGSLDMSPILEAAGGPTIGGRAASGRSYHIDHLQFLETEGIHIMREVAAEFERPCLLFSGGKDSICLLRLAAR